ncbi:dUTPase [Planomicrobium okeanokoites]|nr:dUTPase [Planomicrobium okeanokoites]
MDISNLLEAQKELDAEIEKNHPTVEKEERLLKRTLALLVELGELANELPEVFKFWSNKKNNYEKALEEYVDGLHFFLSIALEEGPDQLSVQRPYMQASANILDCYLDIFEDVSRIDCEIGPLGRSFYRYIELGQMLGFTWEQIEMSYMMKNALNHHRQETGY